MHAASPSSPLPDATAWADALRARLPGWDRVDWTAETGSTNPDVLAVLRNTDTPTTRILIGTHYQTAGRGRGGKDWATQPGDALLFSCGWITALPLDRLPAFTLVAGLAAAQALDPDSPPRVLVKWPNDLYTRDGKLAGILSETVSLPRTGNRALRGLVLGIGINVRQGAALGAALGRPIGDLARIGLDTDPVERVARIAQAWDQALRDFEQGGFLPFQEAYQHRDWLAERRLHLHTPDRIVEGLACGVDAGGRLRLRTADGVQAYALGHVQLAAESA